MTELFINGERVEFTNSPIAQTFQINDMTDVKHRQAGFTNHFKIPQTANNINIFKGLGLNGSTSDITKRQIEVQIRSNGIETARGLLYIRGLENNHYDCLVIFGNKEIEKIFGAKKVASLPLSEFDHFTDTNVIQDSKKNNAGYIYPFATATNFDWLIDSDIQNATTPKCLYIHTLWDKMFAQAGWQYKGAIFSKQDFKKIVLACGNDKNVSRKTTYKSNTPTPRGKLFSAFDFKTDVGGAEEYIEVKKNHFLIKQDGYIRFFVLLYFFSEINAEPDRVKIYIKIGTESIKQTNKETILRGRYVRFETIERKVKKNDTITISISGNFYQLNFSLKDFYFAPHTSSQVPDLMQIDLIKETVQRFGLTYRIVGNVIEFKEMEELLSTSNAEDWSNKYITHKEIYKIGEYAQQNRFKYKYKNKDDDFANGTLNIDNENLPATKTVLESLTQAVATHSPWGKEYCNLELWEIREKEQEGKKGIEIVQTKRPPIIGAIRRDDSDTYFDFKSCHYQNYLNKYYASFGKMLNNQKKVVAKLMLDVYDIYSLDFFRTKYIRQTGKYYYLNKVKNFINNKTPTECELIELP